ncbi:MAG: bifunctional glutamate N-acetyltransferase/amino-acid acetyltransferase ArgJ [Bryobacter sp.]|nr:bifunctional glutamate N-acetyltransferase/amino-acid acetyltransferase ArgJ [Bryobacter sp.]
MKHSLPAGYLYSAVYAGIRKAERDDLGLIVSIPEANGAAVFTQNIVAAAPVVLSKELLKKSRGKVNALLINAGNANCATRTGRRVAERSVASVAKHLTVKPERVLPSSTGVIGVELDACKLEQAMPQLVAGLAAERFEDVARAIMTTDLVMKTATTSLKLGAGTVNLAGMTKGSGMIQPNMATTLGYVMTDAAIGVGELQAILRRAIEVSYNRLTVDGDTSTNDTVVLLANGASGIAPKGKDLDRFEEALTDLLKDLARQIARDGEGARKLVRVVIAGAKSNEEAAQMGRAIANSPLVKTAIAGSDANWGRILAAAGYSGVRFDPAQVDIALQGKRVCQGGLAAKFNEADMKKRLDKDEVLIELRINGKGKGAAEFWTCDFTEGYIEINGSYRS